MNFLSIIAVFFSTVICFKNESFRFANHYADHMVLQKEPLRAFLWGFGEDGQEVDISVTQIETGYFMMYHALVEKDWRGLSTWKLSLTPYKAGGTYKISATSIAGNNQVVVTLNDVLFGDVWLCSGQSNMAFTTGMAANGEKEIDLAEQYHDVRLFTVKPYFSKIKQVELDEMNIMQQWSVASKDSVGGKDWQYFSAVCWMFGRRLRDRYNIPIGLIATSYGGTRVEAWSSPETLEKCNIAATKQEYGQFTDQNTLSSLYNAMIYPIINSTIFGAIWYQGEHNAINPNDPYNCTFPAMINGWRKEWYASTNKSTDQVFPFGFVQLASLKEKSSIRPYFTEIRWKQTAGYGYVPNPKQQRTFMAISMDLPDDNSPFSSIHPRDKTDVADRLVLGARNVAFGESGISWSGPVVDMIELNPITGNRTSISVIYKNSSISPQGIEVRNINGFQITVDSYDNWMDVPISRFERDRVILELIKNNTGNLIKSIRYAWKQEPCAFKLCAVYSSNTNLPAGPFIKYGPFK